MSVFDLRRRSLANLRRPDSPPTSVSADSLSLFEDNRRQRPIEERQHKTEASVRRG